MSHRSRTLRNALVLALAASACGEDAERLAQGDVVSAIETASRALGADSAAARRGPDEIYYDLTAYDWYRRGEPLVAGGFAFQPEGTPRTVPFDSLEPAGKYQGVDFYVRNGTAQPYDTLYIPVFDDYWQPFLPVAPAPAPAPAPAR